jgi:hypothetical protein
LTAVRAGRDGQLVVESARYRLEVRGDGLLAALSSPAGGHWASLRLLAALDCIDGPDETLSVAKPRVIAGPAAAIEIERRSTRWEHAAITLVCSDETIELRAAVGGRGSLTEAHLLGGRSVIPGARTGFLPSGSSFRTLFSPNPGDPHRLLRSAGETAVIGTVGDAEPGRGHWFFTPAPLYLALNRADDLVDPAGAVRDGWLGIGIAAPVDELTFVQLTYQPADQAFSLTLDYDGHTRVDGEFRAPIVVLTPGIPDPYTGLRVHREDLAARRAAPAARRRLLPAWWREPIFCGWGAQRHLAGTTGRRAPELSTQENYDSFLADLESQGVVPGTVVVDDKWQEAYGTCVPDRAKWPDLKGWIEARRSRGQRVLLWWAAWEHEGLAPELCIRNPDGAPVALDPTNPAARAAVQDAVARMLGTDGADADGLKVDFTGRAPSGRALSTHGDAWGIALLHELLQIVYGAAKDLKQDALVITHTPHPAFADVTDMLRLNDMLRLDDPEPAAPIVPQMRYRAEVIRASCPDALIDTDDWCAPDRASWRDYLAVKPEIGVPALYYATHLDYTGERLEPEDYQAIRHTWEQWSREHS